MFSEENLGYKLDDSCGVRYAVDQQFEAQCEATISCMADAKYGSARAAFEDAHRYFTAIPQDLKTSLRLVFESVEIVTKQMISTDRLTAKVVSRDLKSMILAAYGGDPVALRAVGRAIEGFAHWVDGMHHYRHGQGEEEPVVPPETFAIYAISSGAAFVRWLVQINEQTANG